MNSPGPREALAVHAIGDVLAVAAAIAEIRKTLLLVPATRRRQDALRVSGILGDDVDDAVDRVRPPDCAARPADHLDAVDVIHDRVLHFPVRAGQERGVNGAPVDEHQHATARAGVPKPRIPMDHLFAVDARDFHARREPQRLRNAGRPRTPDLLPGDDVDRRRALKSLYRPLGWRSDFNLRQLFQAQLLERRRTCLVRGALLLGVASQARRRCGQQAQYARKTNPVTRLRRAVSHLVPIFHGVSTFTEFPGQTPTPDGTSFHTVFLGIVGLRSFHAPSSSNSSWTAPRDKL